MQTLAAGLLVFSASTTTHGQELWKSAGSEKGTVMVQDINPGAGASYPSNFTAIGNVVYFSAFDGGEDELWKYDGTTLSRIDINPAGSSSAQHLKAVGSELYFSADGGSGMELWKYDGTNAVKVKEIHPGTQDAFTSEPDGPVKGERPGE